MHRIDGSKPKTGVQKKVSKGFGAKHGVHEGIQQERTGGNAFMCRDPHRRRIAVHSLSPTVPNPDSVQASGQTADPPTATTQMYPGRALGPLLPHQPRYMHTYRADLLRRRAGPRHASHRAADERHREEGGWRRDVGMSIHTPTQARRRRCGRRRRGDTDAVRGADGRRCGSV